MKIAYITVQIPYGDQEAFIVPEIHELMRNQQSVAIFPFRPDDGVFHEDARSLLQHTHKYKQASPGIVCLAILRGLSQTKRVCNIAGDILRQSRGGRTKLANLSAIFKGVALAKTFTDLGIEHIHAHWGTRTATFALVVSELTGIPWSMTLHRWDIYTDNILRMKTERAAFVRCISEKGKQDLLRIVGSDLEGKVDVLHLGVDLPDVEPAVDVSSNERRFRMAVPANLYGVKGHKYLIEAADLLVRQGWDKFECVFYGDGTLREELQHEINDRGLASHILIYGPIDHAVLMSTYERREFDVVVLPSIKTKSGHHEGIPIALVEAMAYGIPVVSTSTGSIPELIGDGSGVMVESRDGQALANAIYKIFEDKDYSRGLAEKGRNKVEASFDLTRNVIALNKLFEQHQGKIAG